MHTIILGAGWSGLAAAITLIKKGIKPIILEASPQAGGRAREVTWNDIKIDNGQHLLLGAYTEFINLLELIYPNGFDFSSIIDRVPFELNFYDDRKNKISIERKNNLYFKTQGLSFKDKLSSLRFLRNIYFNKILSNSTVVELLNKSKQSENIKNILDSLCVSALTTNIYKADAKTFQNTLLDSLFKHRKKSDLLIPKVSLSELFVNPACDYIIKNGGEIHLNTRVKNIIFNENKVEFIETNKDRFYSDKYICALPYFAANKLIDNINIPLKSEKISTLYIKYKNNIKLPHKIMGLLNHHIDFIFDKSSEYPGLISAVSSSNNEFNNCSKKEMFEIAFNEIKNLFPELNQVEDYKIITEKFAAYSCDLNSKKINYGNNELFENLILAGDYTYHRYPATLEGAIRSGLLAAEKIN